MYKVKPNGNYILLLRDLGKVITPDGNDVILTDKEFEESVDVKKYLRYLNVEKVDGKLKTIKTPVKIAKEVEKTSESFVAHQENKETSKDIFVKNSEENESIEKIDIQPKEENIVDTGETKVEAPIEDKKEVVELEETQTIEKPKDKKVSNKNSNKKSVKAQV